MTENRRIFWNIIATYGRSLFSLACGLFTARWALNALGVVDYGLVGVVGGLTTFIGFLNGTLASAIGRFYAVSIGQEKSAQDQSAAIEECRHWFNTALSIHFVVPLILMSIGYPIGEWAVRHYLNIPPDRVADCVWVFRFACVTCFLGMVSVPFGAMYGAKQYIAELTIYSYVTTILNVVFMYYMITHPAVWMVRYSFWTMLLALIPQLIIAARAVFLFPECRLRFSYWWEVSRLKQVAYFAWWNFCGMVCGLLRIQGVAVLVNKAFGPQVNAANALANSVNGHASSLSGSLMGAFLPAITVAFGAGDKSRMYTLCYMASKFGCLLLLIFIVPLLAELQNVLAIWLKTPPQYTAFLCFVAIVCNFIDVNTLPHCVAVNATGRVKEYQKNMIKISILTLPAAIITVCLGGGVYALGILLIVVRISISLRRVYYARTLAGLSAKEWMKKSVMPLSFAILLSAPFALLPKLFMDATFLRVVVVTAISEVVLLPLSWFVIMSAEERAFMVEKFGPRLKRLAGRVR